MAYDAVMYTGLSCTQSVPAWARRFFVSSNRGDSPLRWPCRQNGVTNDAYPASPYDVATTPDIDEMLRRLPVAEVKGCCLVAPKCHLSDIPSLPAWSYVWLGQNNYVSAQRRSLSLPLAAWESAPGARAESSSHSLSLSKFVSFASDSLTTPDSRRAGAITAIYRLIAATRRFSRSITIVWCKYSNTSKSPSASKANFCFRLRQSSSLVAAYPATFIQSLVLIDNWPVLPSDGVILLVSSARERARKLSHHRAALQLPLLEAQAL